MELLKKVFAKPEPMTVDEQIERISEKYISQVEIPYTVSITPGVFNYKDLEALHEAASHRIDNIRKYLRKQEILIAQDAAKIRVEGVKL